MYHQEEAHRSRNAGEREFLRPVMVHCVVDSRWPSGKRTRLQRWMSRVRAPNFGDFSEIYFLQSIQSSAQTDT